MKHILFTGFALLTLASCTEQEAAKSFGGTATINLPAGQKLVNVTWKEANLWYLTKPMTPGDSAERYSLKEESSYGLMEGEVVIQESR